MHIITLFLLISCYSNHEKLNIDLDIFVSKYLFVYIKEFFSKGIYKSSTYQDIDLNIKYVKREFSLCCKFSFYLVVIFKF